MDQDKLNLLWTHLCSSKLPKCMVPPLYIASTDMPRKVTSINQTYIIKFAAGSSDLEGMIFIFTCISLHNDRHFVWRHVSTKLFKEAANSRSKI